MNRYLGLDYGDTTVGVAVSCPRAKVATGITTLRRTDPNAMKPLIAQLRTIINEYGITHVVLGNPLHMDGTPSTRSTKTADFAVRLQRNFKRLTIDMWDERLSSRAVARTLGNTRHIDEMAAVYILQGYLDKLHTPKEITMDEKIILHDEAGVEVPFTIIAIEKADDITYLMAESEPDENGDTEIVHFKSTASEGEDIVFDIIHPDDAAFDQIMALFADDYEELGIEIIE